MSGVAGTPFANAGGRYSKRDTLVDVALAVLAGVVALAIYVRSLAPGLLWGDSAEFQFAAWLGGFVHPTGYPLYLILGWLWTHLVPLGDPAFRMNLFSAVWGAVAAGLLCLLVVRVLWLLGSGEASARFTGLGAALVFTFTPTFWSQAVVAEVYTLHAAFTAAILLALLAWAERIWAGDERGPGRRGVAAAALAGLSLTHHRTTLLVLAGAVVFAAVVLVTRRSVESGLGAGRGTTARSRRWWIAPVVALLGPLLLYLYIPLRAPHAPYAQLMLTETRSLPLYDATVGGFIAHVTGSVFSSSLTAGGRGGDVGALLGRFVDELSLNGILLGGLGVLWLLGQAVMRRNAHAGGLLVLTGVTFSAQVLFNQFYGIGDIYVFYIPAYLIWVIWLAVGVHGIASAIRWLLGARWASVASVAAIAGIMLSLAYRGAVTQWPRVQRAGDTNARDAWTAVLAANPEHEAILVSNDRDEMTPLWYLQYVEGRRPDLGGLFPLIQTGQEWATVGQVGDQALATGRPVYLVKPMPGLEVKFDLGAPEGERRAGLGPIVRIAPLQGVSTAAAAPISVFGDTIRLDAVTIEPRTLTAGGVLTVTLEWLPTGAMGENWTTFVQVVAANDAKAGQSDHRPGGAFYPSSLWKTGERLQDVYQIPLAQDLGPGPYRVIAGLYLNEGTELRHLGAPAVVGELP